MKAVIDMGTNTFHLLIGDKKSNIVFKQTIPVKLGEGGGISRGEIIPVAYHRGLEALQQFKKTIDQYPVEEIKATATAAIRDARNGIDFIKEVYQCTQIRIDIITGEQEAEYIYQGAKASGILSSDTALIIDIGGGSTELIIANNEHIFWKDSFRIGAARLLSDFNKSNPISAEDIYNLHRHLETTLVPFLKNYNKYKPHTLIGTAGSFDSFREMILIQNSEETEQINYTFNNQDFTELLLRIIRSTHEERTLMQGLISLRVDMILMASLQLRFILEHTRINKIIACSYSLKEGILFGKKL